MVKGRTGTAGRRVAAGVAVAGVVGLGLLTLQGGAGAAPELPPVSAEDLVASVLSAHPGPFNGTVELDNALGLPALPQVPQAADGTSTARIWSDGEGRGRLQIPTESGERTLVSDGQTFWAWNSDDKTVTKSAEGEGERKAPPEAAATDPAAAATKALADLRATSVVTVDGTAEIAGHPAYELVLAPAPTERTLLREVRIAVDAEKRMPLQLTVLANGSPDPALQIGFTDLTFGAQDASMFTFTPPPGATVTEPPAHPQGMPDGKPDGVEPTAVGDGWDTVFVAKMPAKDAAAQPAAGDRPGGAPDLSALGSPVSGAWGSGRLISTNVANAILTDDGRIAVGAVPEQVLTEALTK
jgi:outer membrane lipoprotein-sorting protein